MTDPADASQPPRRAPPGLAARVTSLAGSATVEMSERVRQLQAAGVEVLPLASGDSNLATHPAIIAAAHRAMLDGETRYGPAGGVPALREGLAARLSRRCGVPYAPGEVIVTPGGKFAVFAAMMAVVESGDEVILLDPCWVSYGPCVRLCGGVPVAVPALDGIDPARLEAAITARTRMIVINSPVNPTGAILGRAELAALLAIAERHDLWLIFDQVYADLAFTPSRYAYLQTVPGAKRRTFVADSLSKTYGMTGWRIGYLAAPESVVKAVLKIVQHSIYCVPPFLQAGAVAGLALPDSVIAENVERFRRRRDRAHAVLDGLPGMRCALPEAGFYLFPAVGGDDRAVAAEWLETLSIAVLPGSAFGAAGAGHLRLSLACADSLLDEALARLARHYHQGRGRGP